MKNLQTFECFSNEETKNESLKSIIAGSLLLLSTQNMDARFGTISGGGGRRHSEYAILKNDALSEIRQIDISGIDNKYELEQVSNELMKRDSDVNIEFCLKMLSDFCVKEDGASDLYELINRTNEFTTDSLDSMEFDDAQKNNLLSVIKDLRKMQTANKNGISQKFSDASAMRHGILNLPQTFVFFTLLAILLVIARRNGFC